MRLSEYNDCTLFEIWIAIDAYGEVQTEHWQRTRFETYMVYCANTEPVKRQSIEDFLPLDGDPSPDERKKQKGKEKRERLAANKKLIEEAAAWRNTQKAINQQLKDKLTTK